jgi:hypothetical protein
VIIDHRYFWKQSRKIGENKRTQEETRDIKRNQTREETLRREEREESLGFVCVRV